MSSLSIDVVELGWQSCTFILGVQKCQARGLSHRRSFLGSSYRWLRWRTAPGNQEEKAGTHHRPRSRTASFPKHARICPFGPRWCWLCRCYSYRRQKFPHGRRWVSVPMGVVCIVMICYSAQFLLKMHNTFFLLNASFLDKTQSCNTSHLKGDTNWDYYYL